MDKYQTATSYADRIENELRALSAWENEPLPEEAYNSRQAFFSDTMTFYQWLQFVLLARIRAIVENRGEFPTQSSVGTYAIRELDGYDEAAALVQILSEFDDFVCGVGENSAKDDA